MRRAAVFGGSCGASSSGGETYKAKLLASLGAMDRALRLEREATDALS